MVRKSWSDNELNILKKYYPISTKEELIKIIPTHNYGVIKAKASYLKLNKKGYILSKIRKDIQKYKQWDLKQIDYLKKNYPFFSNRDLSKSMNKTICAITIMAGRYGLKKDKQTLSKVCSLAMRKINFSRDQLQEWYINNRMSLKDINEITKISKSVIYRRLKEYNIPLRIKEEAKVEKIKTLVGDKHWFYGKHKSKEQIQKWYESNLRNGEFRKQSERMVGKKNPMYGKQHSIETRKKGSASLQGISLDEWKEFTGNLPYDYKFNGKFKKLIKKRDKKCLKCNLSIGELELLKIKPVIHHIDYNKKNTGFKNNCLLCNSCNIKVNKNRNYWTVFFQSLLHERYGYNY